MNLREILGLSEPEPNDSELSISPPSEAVSGIYQIAFPRARNNVVPFSDESLKRYLIFAGKCSGVEFAHSELDIEVDWEGDGSP
jgi:hypothetical protein